MALFCAAIKRDSVPLLKFPFFALSRSYRVIFHQFVSCFSSHFCFLYIVDLFFFTMSVLLLPTVISLYLLFYVGFVSNPLPSFLYPCSLCHHSGVRPGALVSIFIFWSISFVHFKNGPEYLT